MNIVKGTGLVIALFIGWAVTSMFVNWLLWEKLGGWLRKRGW